MLSPAQGDELRGIHDGVFSNNLHPTAASVLNHLYFRSDRHCDVQEETKRTIKVNVQVTD